jgi:two-component system response regulator RegX3
VVTGIAAEGDGVLLRQVLIGLLTNAFKNTPAPGAVTLRARGLPDGEVLIEVEDTGNGIAPDEVGRVFERFYRGSKALAQEGFGLGLSIAKRIRVGRRQYLLGAPSGRRHSSHPGRMIMADGRILIADDEPSVRDAVGYALEQEGFDVTLAEDGDDADRKIGAETPNFDLLILDIMMPGRSGLDICRDVRARSPVPIILLTAKDAEVDKVVGLEVGADDYVTKPFSVRELLGRVRAQLRRRELDRTSSEREGKTIDAGPVRIDLARHLVTIRGEPVNLTRSEFQVLRLLAERPGQVFSRLEIMEELWQSEFSGDVRACDVHISNLRQKIERDPQEPELVLTVRGVGYRLSEDGT